MHAKATLMYFRLSLLFSREQRCYRMLFRLIGGRRNIPKQRDISNVETYDQKQVQVKATKNDYKKISYQIY